MTAFSATRSNLYPVHLALATQRLFQLPTPTFDAGHWTQVCCLTLCSKINQCHVGQVILGVKHIYVVSKAYANTFTMAGPEPSSNVQSWNKYNELTSKRLYKASEVNHREDKESCKVLRGFDSIERDSLESSTPQRGRSKTIGFV